MTQEEAQKLLEESVAAGKARYNVCDDYCYKSFSHATDEKGRLTNKQYKKALRKPLELEFGS